VNLKRKKVSRNKKRPAPKCRAEDQETLLECVHAAGDILLRYFGRIIRPRQKENTSSVVCDADLASEKQVIRILRSRFPNDGIIAEESGFQPGPTGRTWIIDPLDGTSNFVAGLPWFGVQMALLEGTAVKAAAMLLPIDQVLYHAVPGGGAFRNGKPVRTQAPKRLSETLCAFGFDADARPTQRRRAVELLMSVAEQVRNTRATNSLVDFCYTLEGKFGGCINLCTKIWDIAPAMLILPEAGVSFSALDGAPIQLDLTPKGFGRNYAIATAASHLHRPLIELTARHRSDR